MTRTRLRELALPPQAISELFKPARLEIFECLQLSGPCSVAELAARVDRAPDALYYHLKKLIEIGVVERSEDAAEIGDTNGKAGRNGAVYDTVADRVKLQLEPGSRKSREAWAGGARAVLRIAERNVCAALESDDIHTEGPRRNLFVSRLKVRLNTRELKELNRHLNALQEILRGHSKNTRGRPCAITTVLTPLSETSSR